MTSVTTSISVDSTVLSLFGQKLAWPSARVVQLTNPEVGAELRALLPPAEVEIFSGAGHSFR